MSPARSIIRFRLCAIDLIGVSELLISCDSTRTMRCQARCSSSRSARLKSEKHDQLVRPTVAAEGRPPQLEPRRLIAERALDPAPLVAFEVRREPDLRRALAEQRFLIDAEQALAGAIDQHEMLVGIEGEHGDVNRRDDAREQRRRFHRLAPLPLQRLAQRVDLEHDEVERAFGRGADAANRVVALPQRAEQVRDEKQRPRDALIRGRRALEPRHDDDRRRRPADLEGVVVGPNQVQQPERGRQRRRQGR